MTAKLTLTIEDQVLDSAKEYARKEGKSLSSLVENYLKAISAPQVSNSDISERVSKMRGVIKLPEDFDYKKELADALTEKYK